MRAIDAGILVCTECHELNKQQAETDTTTKAAAGADAAEATLATLTGETSENKQADIVEENPIRKPAKASSRHKKPKRPSDQS